MSASYMFVICSILFIENFLYQKEFLKNGM